MTLRFVITATDTGVGKTVFAAALVQGLKAHYWKPIQAGLIEETDSVIVARLSGLPKAYIIPEIYRLKTPVSPHFSAELDEIKINPQRLLSLPTNSSLVIEGAGGILVPLTEDRLFVDVFKLWQIPVILCARTELGTINHTLLSLEALRYRSIPVFGIVFIGAEQMNTQRTIANLGKVRVLGRLPWLNSLNAATLKCAFQQCFSLNLFQGVAQ